MLVFSFFLVSVLSSLSWFSSLEVLKQGACLYWLLASSTGRGRAVVVIIIDQCKCILYC